MTKIMMSTLNRYKLFLPHHGVLKEQSVTTKLRIVFDASSKTKSFNDIQLVGPTFKMN